MSDIGNVIHDIVAKQPNIIAYNIASALQEPDITPRDTNNLVNGWAYGPMTSGHVMSKGASEYEKFYLSVKTKSKTESLRRQDEVPFQPVTRKPYKKGTLNRKFMIWNNVPYLSWRNDGWVYGRLTGADAGFMGNGIRRGEDRASAEIAAMPKT